MAISDSFYSPLRRNEEYQEGKPRKSLTFTWKSTLLFFLSIFTTVLLILLAHQKSTQNKQSHDSHTPLDPLSTPYKWTRYTWWSGYSSAEPKDIPKVDHAWDAIVPAHGIVAVNHDWTLEKGLPDTMNLPSDSSKGVYIIDAYHQLHCLTIIRKSFFELARGQTLTYPAGHSTHCFDSIRQYIMCTAGDTLLYTWGRNETGDGQLRKCRDWTYLRDWATEHSACYQDSAQPIPIKDHFGQCDDGVDGIIL